MTLSKRAPLLVLLVGSLSPLSSALAGDHGGHAAELVIPWVSIGWHAVNLTLLVVVIFLLVRRPARDAIRNRALHVRRAIEEANKARDAARAQAQELEGRLADFQTQMDRMRQEVRADALKERQLILDQADRDAEAVLVSAERAIHDEAARARRGLQQEAAKLAIELADEILRKQVTPVDHARLSEDLLTAIRTRNPDSAGGPDAR
jgi:F-type H+-transporting ATPase subunit b